MRYVVDLKKLSMSDLEAVGGKNASLGEMLSCLSHQGIKVPGGFSTTSKGYEYFLQANDLQARIQETLKQASNGDTQNLDKISANIRQWILEASFPDDMQESIAQAYAQMVKGDCGCVAVRSSATSEDLPEASFAGQQETFLNVSGLPNVLEAIKKVYASLFCSRAISYRQYQGFNHNDVAIAAAVQTMVRSDKAASGVIFTLDTESGFEGVVFITGAYGLGETIVQGAVNPDEFYLYKPNIKSGKSAILRRNLGEKALKMIYSKDVCCNTETVKVPKKEQGQFCLTDQEVETLAKMAVTIEDHYAKPMDIEWAKDGETGELYIVQARPETVQSHNKHHVIKQYRLKDKGPIIISGRAVGQKIGQGVARIIESPQDMHRLKPGEILVTDMTDPDWEPIMKLASGIVTNRGGRTCHAAIIARELGIPAVIACKNATDKIDEGDGITLCCSEGETGQVYKGLLPFHVDKIKVDELPEPPCKITMNLANPDKAFSLRSLPNHGVGLARLEFIINHMIGIHPHALLQLEALAPALKATIMQRIQAYSSPREYYIERLKEGVATIAAAFYPNPIIVRFSDFKSNEYANLIGGKEFEPHEENPMLGFRGASRYVSESFIDCFAMECEAMKRVRDTMGLDNAHVMLPFVRTVAEAKAATQTMAEFGLQREPNGLQCYMMCEIPSNALLAKDFLEYFDGFSIGSNDLTQLTLGLDRDSGLIADQFDERDPAVKALLHEAIQACLAQGKYVGICGQGPSDYPDFAAWLVGEGIESISLNPDTVVETWVALSKVANKSS